MLTPGIFDCRTIRALWSESSQKKTPCIAVQAIVTDDDGAEAKLWGNIYITDATVGTAARPGMAVQQLRALGYKGPLSALHPDPKALVDVATKCTVEAQNNGSMRIAMFGVSQGMQGVAMELSRLQALDKQFGIEPSVDSFDKQQAEDEAAMKGLEEPPAPGSAIGKEPTDDSLPF